MKTAPLARAVLLILAALVLSPALVTAADRPVDAQATLGHAFTYQGRLLDGGVAANGLYDLGFVLFDAETGGGFISNAWVEDVTVTNGLFTVSLDFGDVFRGTAYWLQVAVRPGASTGDMTILTPRTPLNPYPYAMTAHTVRTDLTSYYFIPGAHAVLHAASHDGELAYYGQGAARLVSSGAGPQDIVFPVSLPGTLYSQPVSINRIYLDYVSSAATADITSVEVYRTPYDGTYRVVYSATGPWDSTTWDEIAMELPEGERRLAGADGYVAVRVRCSIASGQNIMFGGLEISLAHQ